MELLFLVIGLVGLGLAAGRYGADTRPRVDDKPHRAI